MNEVTGVNMGEAVSEVKTFGRDLLERVLTSAVGGAIAGVSITEPLNGSMWYAALAAGVAAGFSVVKGVFAKARGNSDSASLTKSV